MDQDTDEVPHGTGDNKEGVVFAKEASHVALEEVDGGISADNIIVNVGLGHGLAHLRGGFGDGVGAEVDEAGAVAVGSRRRGAIAGGGRRSSSR
jgi:hypothetical protein